MPEQFITLNLNTDRLLDALFKYMKSNKLPPKCEFCYNRSGCFFTKDMCSQYLDFNQMLKSTTNNVSQCVNNSLNMLNEKALNNFLKQLEENTPKPEEWGKNCKIPPPSLGRNIKMCPNVLNGPKLIKELNYYIKNKKLSSNCAFYSEDQDIYEILTPDEQDMILLNTAVTRKIDGLETFDNL